MNELKITLYVKSEKRAVKNEEVGMKTHSRYGAWADWGSEYAAPRNVSSIPTYETVVVTKYSWVLPENQEKILNMVRDVAEEEKVGLEVIDVNEVGHLHKIFSSDFRQLKVFPTLVAGSGRKLEGEFSKEDLGLFLSQENGSH